MPITLKIEIEGNSDDDIDAILNTVRHQVMQGFRKDERSTPTGKYSFEVTGESVSYYRIASADDKLEDKRFSELGAAIASVVKRGYVVGFNENDEEIWRSYKSEAGIMY
jgi:hypothetical protein